MNTIYFEQAQRIVAKIVEKFHPEKIILFGSYAWGKPSEDSDFDILVIAETEKPRALAVEIDLSISPRSLPIDILVYTPDKVRDELDLGEPFLTEVINAGKILYER